LFEKKANRAKKRLVKRKQNSTSSPQPSSDASKRRSKSSSSSSSSSSVSCQQSQLTAPKINEAILPDNKDNQGSEVNPIGCDSEASYDSNASSPSTDTEPQ